MNSLMMELMLLVVLFGECLAGLRIVVAQSERRHPSDQSLLQCDELGLPVSVTERLSYVGESLRDALMPRMKAGRPIFSGLRAAGISPRVLANQGWLCRNHWRNTLSFPLIGGCGHDGPRDRDHANCVF